MADLRVDELAPTGGSWTGLLFENPAVDRALALTWTFTFDFADLDREYGSVAPSLSVDWIPAGESGWQSMGGRRFRSDRFADPAEASLYFFDHHRFDQVEVVVHRQDGETLDVTAVVRGDLDDLGIEAVSARAVLGFGGIYVQTEATGTDPIAAAESLRRFTDVSGLRPRARSHNVVFEPVG